MKSDVVVYALQALILALLIMPTTSVLGAEPAPATTAAVAWVKTELYFGREIPGGHEVSRNEWNAFLDQVITPRFPAGLTVMETYGQMRHTAGPIEKQATWVVLLVHPQDAANEKAVQEVIAAYRKQFHNPQVMHLSLSVTSQFFAD